MEKWMRNQGFECLHVVKRLHKSAEILKSQSLIVSVLLNSWNYKRNIIKDKFKIILVTPGLEKSSLKLYSYEKDIKIEGEIPSIEGIFIKNNLPFGKFVITLTLPDKFDKQRISVRVEKGYTFIILKQINNF
ncbi:unnamed protein product [Rhizophagus irregularis]|nr:unnamed protein product [Rhizophagus irregularis]